MATPQNSGNTPARPNVLPPTLAAIAVSDFDCPAALQPAPTYADLEAAAFEVGEHPERTQAVAQKLGIGRSVEQTTGTVEERGGCAVSDPRTEFTAKPVQDVFALIGQPRATQGRLLVAWEVVDRRCWPTAVGGGLDHYGVTVEDAAPARVGDLVMLDVDTYYGDGAVEWLLARCVEPDVFIDLRTGTVVPAERNPSVHGRVVQETWWMSQEDPADPAPPSDDDEDYIFVSEPKRVTLTDTAGSELQAGFWASAPLYDCMVPACPRNEEIIFQHGDGEPGDIVLADVEQGRRAPAFSSSTFMVIGRLGKDGQGRLTLRSDQPGFAYTAGHISDGIETEFAIWGHAVTFPVDCSALQIGGAGPTL